MTGSAGAALSPGAVQVRPALWPGDLDAARHLLHLYFAGLRDDPAVPDEIRTKDRQPELTALGASSPNASAAFLLAWMGDAVCGCVTVQCLAARPGAAELKRLFVLQEARGSGVGGALVLACAAWARQHGARELLLDTLPAAMPGAVRLYRSLGFAPTARYNGNEGSCFAFFRLSLE